MTTKYKKSGKGSDFGKYALGGVMGYGFARLTQPRQQPQTVVVHAQPPPRVIYRDHPQVSRRRGKTLNEQLEDVVQELKKNNLTPTQRASLEKQHANLTIAIAKSGSAFIDKYQRNELEWHHANVEARLEQTNLTAETRQHLEGLKQRIEQFIN